MKTLSSKVYGPASGILFKVFSVEEQMLSKSLLVDSLGARRYKLTVAVCWQVWYVSGCFDEV